MKFKLVILMFFLSININSQEIATKTLNTQKESKIKENKIDEIEKSQKITLNIPNEIKISNPQIETKDFWSKNFPWLSALTVGVISAFVNLFVAKRLRKSNEDNLKEQLDSAKSNLITQYKATVSTKNRQEWINEVRHELSQFLTNFTLLTNDNHEREKMFEYLEKMIFSKSKIELLLNHDKPEQIALIDSIQNLVEYYTENANNFSTDEQVKYRSEIIHNARNMFELHWRKIKNLE